MKERTVQDQQWIAKKTQSEIHNRQIFHGRDGKNFVFNGVVRESPKKRLARRGLIFKT